MLLTGAKLSVFQLLRLSTNRMWPEALVNEPNSATLVRGRFGNGSKNCCEMPHACACRWRRPEFSRNIICQVPSQGAERRSSSAMAIFPCRIFVPPATPIGRAHRHRARSLSGNSFPPAPRGGIDEQDEELRRNFLGWLHHCPLLSSTLRAGGGVEGPGVGCLLMEDTGACWHGGETTAGQAAALTGGREGVLPPYRTTGARVDVVLAQADSEGSTGWRWMQAAGSVSPVSLLSPLHLVLSEQLQWSD